MTAAAAPIIAVAVALTLAGCSGSLRAKFPTEEEVRARLAKGMTAEQVLATFGEPAGHHWVDVNLGGKVHYIAPPATRRKPGEGYAGFTVYFDRGKVWDWEVILLNPSYEPRLLPHGARSWQVRLLAGVALVAAGFFGVRFLRAHFSIRKELLEAYVARSLPAGELPPEFRFLHDATTLQDVFDEAGQPSRVRRLPSQNAGETVAAYEYELPDDSKLFVMPEVPSQPESRIRAVVYRRSW